MFQIKKITSNTTVDFAAEELKKYMRMMMPECGEISIEYAPDAADGLRLGLMADFGLAPSKSEARRLVMQGGVALDGEKITDPKAMLTREALSNEPVLKKGKKNFYKIIIK